MSAAQHDRVVAGALQLESGDAREIDGCRAVNTDEGGAAADPAMLVATDYRPIDLEDPAQVADAIA